MSLFKISPRQTPFTGRHDDLAMLEDWHSQQPSNLLTITGVPGVGKTRLLREWLSRMATPYHFVDLRGCFSELQLLEQLAVQLGIETNDTDPHLDLAKALNGSTLALDNAEHIIAEVRSFLEKLQARGIVQVVVTSREAIGIEDEIKCVLQPFDVHTSNSESHSSATTIFSYWLQRQHLETENKPHLEELLQFTQGIPLMIELLAGQAGQFSLETISHLVKQSATAELRHRSHLDDIHKDYERAVTWSCKLLEPDELAVFQHVSMFNTMFTIEDCQWVLGESWTIKTVTRCLLRLVEKNLIQQQNPNSQSEPHFAWLIPIQSTMRGLLEPQQQRNFERRHTEWVVHVLKGIQRNLILEEKQALEAVENLLPEANYALERTKLHAETDSDLPQLMIALVRYMYLYWSVKANYQEAVIWFEQLNRFPAVKEDKTWVLTRFYLAACEGELGLSRRAEQHFIENIALAREISSEHLILGLQNYAAFLSDANRHAEAIPLLEECLRTNSTQENKEYHTNVQLNSLAIAFDALGDVDRAIGFFEQRLEILRKFGSPFEVACAALNCGVALLMNRQRAKAIPLLVEALATFEQNGSLEGQRVALLALGRDALDSDPRAALIRFTETLETNPELNSEIRNKALMGRGIGYAKLGQVKLAVDVWVAVFRTAIASSALERITEAFEFLLYFIAESEDSLSATLGLQLIGWYTVFFESLHEISLEAEHDEALQFKAKFASHVEPTQLNRWLNSGQNIVSKTESQRRLFRSIALKFASVTGKAPLEITSKQLEILHLAARGLENKELAKELKISPKTVASHLEQLFTKFEVRNRTELVQKAQELGLLEPPV